MNTLLQDIRYGLRGMLKSPAFTVVAVIALALGIGANSAIFSVVNSVLLRPLPYSNADRLVRLWDVQQTDKTPAAYQEFDFWRSQNHTMEGVVANYNSSYILTGTGEPERIRGQRVTNGFFATFGIAPKLGRDFLPEEDRPHANHVVLLSDGLWKRRFGGDSAIVGQSIRLNGNSYTVVGVLPPDPGHLLDNSELFTPLAIDGSLVDKGTHFLNVTGKLKSGVAIAQAQSDLDTVADRFRHDNSTTHGVSLINLQEQIVGQSRQLMFVLLGAVAFVLLIACANVANLLLARSAGREKEIALRTALGASRLRIVKQLLTESVLLSVVGGLCGIGLAFLGLRMIVSLGADVIPRSKEIGLDSRVMLFTVALSVLTGILFGLVPALRSSRQDLNESLKGAGRSSAAGFGGRNMRSALIVSEIALTLMLLIGAGLLIKSFVRLSHVNPGFNPDNVLAVDIILPISKYGQEAQQAAFYDDLLNRIKVLPQVHYVGAISNLPLAGSETNGDFEVEGHEPWPPGQEPVSEKYVASSDYFRAMGISLLKGRFFTDSDVKSAPAVAIVNQSLAQKIWPNQDPLGKKIKIGWLNNDWQEVVGVVNNVKHETLDAQDTMETYTPYTQTPIQGLTLAIRTDGNPNALIGSIRSQVQNIDHDQPIANVATLDEVMSKSLAPRRFNMMLLAIFAAIALVLAAVGIYGVMAYSVNQRTQEIGIRLALGAQKGNVLLLIVGQGMTLSIIGVGIGLASSWWLTRLMASLLYGVTATDAATFGSISALLLAIAFLSCYLPGRRASMVDPITALRYE